MIEIRASQVTQVGKNPPANSGDAKSWTWIRDQRATSHQADREVDTVNPGP